MNDSNIICPKCGAEIPLTEAVSHRLREQLQAQFERERADLNAALAARESRIEAEAARLAEERKTAEGQFTKRLENERTKLLAEAIRQAEDKLGVENKDLLERLREREEKLKTAQKFELELRKQKREIEEAKAAMDLDLARKLDEERQKIADDARRQALEAEHLKLADKEKMISDLQREIQNLKQKADQGSVQLQGETLELELERILGAAFPHDEITEVKTGQRGADAIQRVRTNTGFDCGSILWEAKRARNWSAQWPEKLKGDQRETKAELSVVVTTCPPEEIRGIGQLDGVWVCTPEFATGLAAALRQGLISTAVQRLQETHRTDKMALLYDHLCSVEFRQHIEALVESFLGLKEQLAAEQRAFARQWKEREQQLEKAIRHTAMLYGGIQGIAGREALPEIDKLSLPTA